MSIRLQSPPRGGVSYLAAVPRVGAPDVRVVNRVMAGAAKEGTKDRAVVPHVGRYQCQYGYDRGSAWGPAIVRLCLEWVLPRSIGLCEGPRKEASNRLVVPRVGRFRSG